MAIEKRLFARLVSAASLFRFSTWRSFPPEAHETRGRLQGKKRRRDISGGLSRPTGKNPAGKPVGETSDTAVININRINPDAFTWQAAVAIFTRPRQGDIALPRCVLLEKYTKYMRNNVLWKACR